MLVDELLKVGETKFSWDLYLPKFMANTKEFRFKSDIFKIENPTCHDFSAQMIWKREERCGRFMDKVSMASAK